MGTRINVLLDHDLPDYREQSAVIARLEATVPATLAVRDYWNAASVTSKPESDDQWMPVLCLCLTRSIIEATGGQAAFFWALVLASRESEPADGGGAF